jgi:predicted TIM-barrel fold metal-dependent hydrolase
MSSAPIVDAHHHIWRRDAVPWLAGPPQPRIFGEYGALRRDYLIARAGQHLPLTEVNAALLQAAVDLHGPDVDPAAVIAAIRAQVDA